MLDGVDLVSTGQNIQFQGVTARGGKLEINGKIGFSDDHPMLSHFRFLKKNTKLVPKMTIPSPTVLHFRLEPDAIKTKRYQHFDDIYEDLAKTYKKAIKAKFYKASVAVIFSSTTPHGLISARRKK